MYICIAEHTQTTEESTDRQRRQTQHTDTASREKSTKERKEHTHTHTDQSTERATDSSQQHRERHNRKERSAEPHVYLLLCYSLLCRCSAVCCVLCVCCFLWLRSLLCGCSVSAVLFCLVVVGYGPNPFACTSLPFDPQEYLSMILRRTQFNKLSKNNGEKISSN